MANNDYEIVSVEPTDPPPGAAGTGWHCYIIRQDANSIRGYLQGNIQFVTQAVEEIVARSNERRFSRTGRVHLIMSSPRKRAGGQ